MKFIDHLPDDPHPISDVYAAARFVLHGTRSASPICLSTAPSRVPSSLDNVVKAEQLGTIFTEFTKSIIAVINSSQPRAASSLTGAAPRKLECAFCGKEHFIRNCDLVEEYSRDGKIKRNVEGKVILPTGAYVPRDIPGKFLQERIDEWHRRHPGQLAAASILYSTLLNSVSTPQAAPLACIPSQTHSQSPAESRIAALEAEIARLCAKRPAVTSLINSRLQPFDTAVPTMATCQLSPEPRALHLDHALLDPNRVAIFSCSDFCSTQRRTFPTPMRNSQCQFVRFPLRLRLLCTIILPRRQIFRRNNVPHSHALLRRFTRYIQHPTTSISDQNTLRLHTRSQKALQASYTRQKTKNMFYRRALALPSSQKKVKNMSRRIRKVPKLFRDVIRPPTFPIRIQNTPPPSYTVRARNTLQLCLLDPPRSPMLIRCI